MNKNSKWLPVSVVMIASALLITGCDDPNSQLMETPVTSGKVPKEYVPSARAGVWKDISKSLDPNRSKGLIASTARFGYRQNPFALSAEEIAFDKSQASERFVSEDGFFSASFELPEDKTELVVVEEAQPYRRLSGIVIGDAVYAILEQNGQSTIIYPGMLIPNTNWRVASIDRDKAILRREGPTRPNEVEVRLEVSSPFSNAGGAAAGGPAAGGPPGGGRPGAGGPPGGGRPGVPDDK